MSSIAENSTEGKPMTTHPDVKSTFQSTYFCLALGGVVLDVFFEHEYLVRPHEHTIDVTFCVIRSEEERHTMAGMAMRNPKDDPDWTIGDRIAFQKALKSYYSKYTDTHLGLHFTGFNDLWQAARKALYAARVAQSEKEKKEAAEKSPSFVVFAAIRSPNGDQQ